MKSIKPSSWRAGWKHYTCYGHSALSKIPLWPWNPKLWPLSACQNLGDNSYSSDSHCAENILPQADIVLTQWSSLPKGWCDDAHCGADSPFMEHSLSCQALKERCSVHCLCVTGSSSRPEKATWLNLGAPVTSMGACGSPETRPLSLSRITGALQNTHSFHAAALCLELYCWVVMHRNSRTCQFNQQSTAKALFNFGYILKHIYWVLKSLQFKWQSLFAPQRMFKTTKDHLKLAQFFGGV